MQNPTNSSNKNSRHQNIMGAEINAGHKKGERLIQHSVEKLHRHVHELGVGLAEAVGRRHLHIQELDDDQNGFGTQNSTTSRFGSFAEPRNDGEVKWHVDGCSYMHAISDALKMAKQSIWIMDCKLDLVI